MFDFYYYRGDVPEDASIGDILVYIVANRQVYKDFLIYCRDNEMSFIDSENREYMKKAYFLAIFEERHSYLTSDFKSKIIEILSCRRTISLELPNTTIPGTETTFQAALLKSLYRNLEISADGEVLYFIESEMGLNKVFSFESGIHHVDGEGVKVNRIDIHTDKRQQVLSAIKMYQDVLSLTRERDFSTPQIQEWIEIYIDDSNKEWTGSLSDHMRFRSWIGEQLLIAEQSFQDLTVMDERNPKLRLVNRNDFVGENKGREPPNLRLV